GCLLFFFPRPRGCAARAENGVSTIDAGPLAGLVGAVEIDVVTVETDAATGAECHGAVEEQDILAATAVIGAVSAGKQRCVARRAVGHQGRPAVVAAVGADELGAVEIPESVRVAAGELPRYGAKLFGTLDVEGFQIFHRSIEGRPLTRGYAGYAHVAIEHAGI